MLKLLPPVLGLLALQPAIPKVDVEERTETLLLLPSLFPWDVKLRDKATGMTELAASKLLLLRNSWIGSKNVVGHRLKLSPRSTGIHLS